MASWFILYLFHGRPYAGGLWNTVGDRWVLVLCDDLHTYIGKLGLGSTRRITMTMDSSTRRNMRNAFGSALNVVLLFYCGLRMVACNWCVAQIANASVGSYAFWGPFYRTFSFFLSYRTVILILEPYKKYAVTK